MIQEFVKIIFCHLLGDYPLQQDFIAQSKGSNWYHLFVHCALYCVPFAVVYGIDYKLLALFISHLIIDALKARYEAIDYAFDQFLHYVIAFVLYLVI